MTMDAGDRAELDALRRRAYGQDADIHDDADALVRLIELEDLARPAVSDTPRHPQPPAVPEGDADGPQAPTAAQPQAPAERAPAPRSRRRGLPAAVIAAAATIVVALVVAGAIFRPAVSDPPAASPTPTPGTDRGLALLQEAGSDRLMTLWLNRSFSSYQDSSLHVETLPFPASGRLRWATPLGEYYGWMLWVAGSGNHPDSEHCIMIIRGTDVRARCASPIEQTAGTLHVSLTGSDIAPAEQPRPLGDDERIRFWWLQDDSIDVLLAPFPPD